MHQSIHNPDTLQSHLGELKASLDAYLNRNLEFSELRTLWITELANRPDMGKGALRLLYQQPMNRHLTEERVLSLKRIAESAINQVDDDWTVAFDEDGDEISLPAPNHHVTPPVQAAPRAQAVNRPGKAQAELKQRVPKSPVDVQQSIPVDVLAPGFVLCDRFMLEEPLGRGGIGIVYKARDRLRQSTIEGSDRIALKVLRGEFRANQVWRDAFQREALRAQSLSHPNIVRVYDFRQDGETSFVTMELLEGESLSALFARLEPATISTKRAMQIIAGMCHGLAYAHARDVVHADFKPANVFVTAADEPKILDFGFTGAVTTSARQGLDNAALRVITRTYASCNRLEGGAPVIGDDVYSLSCVIYELLAGHHPYDKKSAPEARELNLQPERIDGLTDLQWRTLSAGLRPSPQDRTTEVHDLKEAFAEQLPIQPLSTPVVINPVVKEIVVRKLSFAWAVFATVFGAMLGAVVVAGMVLLGIQPVPSKYADLARESALAQALQSTFGGHIEEPNAAGATESSERLPDKSTDTNGKSIRTISDPQAAEQATLAVAVEPGPESTAVRMSETAAPDLVGTLPTLDDEPEAAVQDPVSTLPALDDGEKPAVDPPSTVASSGDAGSNVSSATPVFYLGSAAYFVREDGIALTVQIQRQGDVSASSSVDFTTGPGSADPQLDYAGVFRRLVQFPAGARTQDIFIPIVSDEIAESDENFLIRLSSYSGEVTLGEPVTATVTIVDDD